ncbi:ABC transporter ATP-binding protein [Wenxinia marina]|uniref:ABC-type multidrug transport system, ATPase and permease component n=1 Tax=Wenxinia marina DSM 24838 TaxID=1123501 RepID=A0A0D0Q744_9RHOB|nr:ABC transporter ATP-binding protein [Wenxinia marina]KIQ68272.1 ABC-type multidrug transport system, ATPase and permease component [Wenxinia marina DSM 24838]GGL79320.1 ABC transporter ATP-binding protein [Wenxinia marina]
MSAQRETGGRLSSLLGWLWRDYLRRHKGRLAAGAALMAVEGAMLGVLARLVEPMFDRIFVGGNAGALTWVAGAVFGVFLVRAICSLGQRVLLTRVREVAAADLRSDLMGHLMVLDVGWHQRNPPGYLVERVQGDVTAINAVWTSIITGFGRDLVSVIALTAVALSVDWRWTLVALLGIPILVVPSLLAQAYVRRRARAAREVAGRMSVRLDEVFHGVAPIKLNALEAYQAARFRRLMDERVSVEVKTARGQAAIPALMDIMSGLGAFAVLLYGGSQILAGGKSLGEFLAFFTAMSLMFEPLRRLGNLSGQWQAAAASMERLRAILDERPGLATPAVTTPAPAGAPEIVLDDVTAAYGDLTVLHGATFTARAGETTALVGPSGAGKSTVFGLLTRLVDPVSGEVTIGGVPTRQMALPDLRGLFSVVTQDALLFDESVRDNILLGRTDVSPARLEEVLQAAHVADFLPQLAGGLDAPAGPRGSALSGGQRQRVAIARALLRDTPILLLDEATSALDSRSEAVVQEALDRLAAGRTTLVIAHRLSTVRRAHSIVVMERGRVVQQGSHDELIARGGAYAELHRAQAAPT